MARMKLTAKVVENLKPPATGRAEYFDAALPGLFLRITHRDVRSWGLFYRLDGKQVRHTLGRFPAMGLGDARKAAGAVLDKVDLGEDPRQEAEAKRQAARLARSQTFETVLEEFNKRYLTKRRSGPERHAAMKRVFVPAWGKLPIGAIDRADVIKLLDGIEDAGTPYARNRRLADVRKFFNWAQHDRGLVDRNPASRIGLLPEARRERVLTDDEIRALWAATGELGEPFGHLFRLLLVTAQRRDECATIEKPDLDRKAKLWTIPGAKTKNTLPHTVPLASTAIGVLDDLREWKDAYLFTTTNGKRPVSGFAKAKEKLDSAMLTRLRQAAEEAGGDPKKVELVHFTLHDLRRTAATRMGELGVDRFIIGRVLNHTDRAITGIYDRHAYDKEKRRALERWAAQLERILADRNGGEVVSLPGARSAVGLAK